MSSSDGFRPEWAQKDFYAELGVKKDATADEIKKAYRKLARLNHPDSNPGDDAKHEKFKAVAEAYDVVGDVFDPTVHEALSHIGEDPDVEVTTCKVVAKSGYRIGDRVVRAAQVLVVDPVGPPEPDQPSDQPSDQLSDQPEDEPDE